MARPAASRLAMPRFERALQVFDGPFVAEDGP